MGEEHRHGGGAAGYGKREEPLQDPRRARGRTVYPIDTGLPAHHRGGAQNETARSATRAGRGRGRRSRARSAEVRTWNLAEGRGREIQGMKGSRRRGKESSLGSTSFSCRIGFSLS